MRSPARNAKPTNNGGTESQSLHWLLKLEFATRVVVVPLSNASDANGQSAHGDGRAAASATTRSLTPPSPAGEQEPAEQTGLMQTLESGVTYVLTPRPVPVGVVCIRSLRKEEPLPNLVAEITECRPVENLGFLSVAATVKLRRDPLSD